MKANQRVEMLVFPTDLGWMAGMMVNGRLAELVFGDETPQDAARRLMSATSMSAVTAARLPAWVRLLQRYAAGHKVDLREVPLALPASLTPFQRRVLQLCRAIPYGRVATYGELATRAGYPGAARAVGNVMAANRVPIVVPCHRVVPAGGKLGRYSAPGGTRTKLRLLEMEGCGRTFVAETPRRQAVVA